MKAKNLQTAVLGGGCFWCMEAVFLEISGVEKVISGYAGGNVPGHPTYREVRSGLTGHAEVVQVTFNAHVVSYKTILTIFMTMHNPTTLNQQGADKGTQYRSVIFYYNSIQKNIAKTVVTYFSPYFDAEIVTEINALAIFYKAEKEHQDYYRNNKNENYCSFVITPKLAQLRKLHTDKLKAVKYEA